MAAIAIVAGRRIYCDGAVGKLVVEPFRAPFVVALPFVALTPLAIVSSLLHGARLTTAGWAIMIAYALAAVAVGVRIVLAPPRVQIDLQTKRAIVGKDEVAADDAKAAKVFDFVGGEPLREPFAKAMRGEPAGDLESAIDELGTEYAKSLIMRLVLLVAPGLMFAYAAVF